LTVTVRDLDDCRLWEQTAATMGRAGTREWLVEQRLRAVLEVLGGSAVQVTVLPQPEPGPRSRPQAPAGATAPAGARTCRAASAQARPAAARPAATATPGRRAHSPACSAAPAFRLSASSSATSSSGSSTRIIARIPCHDPCRRLRSQRPAQPPDVRAQRRHGRRRGQAVPHHLRQRLGRNRHVRVQQQGSGQPG
jgi:hypothetical protein